MVTYIIAAVVLFAAGFLTGFLVFRNNQTKANEISNKIAEVADDVAEKAEKVVKTAKKVSSKTKTTKTAK